MRSALYTLLWVVLGAIPVQAQQYYELFQQEYFFGNLPNARTEAMGKTDVAIGGSVPSIFLNPAGIGTIAHAEASFSFSRPYYALINSKYYFGGGAYRINEKLVVALSHHQFRVGVTGFTVDIYGQEYEMDLPYSANTAVSAAFMPIENLHVGLNINRFRWKLFDDASPSGAWHLDAGVLYKLPHSEDDRNRWQLGASVNNVTNAAITYSSPIGTESTSYLPVVSRAGLTWLADRLIKIKNLPEIRTALTTSIQFQTLLNNDYRRGINIGSEAEFNEAFAFRLGYFRHNLNDGGFPNNRSVLHDITYGFGLIIPVADHRIRLDYVSLKAPSYVYSGRRLDNMHCFTVHLELSEFKAKPKKVNP